MKKGRPLKIAYAADFLGIYFAEQVGWVIS